jgi:hypothetical protein
MAKTVEEEIKDIQDRKSVIDKHLNIFRTKSPKPITLKKDFNRLARSMKELADDLVKQNVEMSNSKLKANLDSVLGNKENLLIKYEVNVKKLANKIAEFGSIADDLKEFRVIVTPFKLSLLSGYIEVYETSVRPRLAEIAQSASGFITSDPSDNNPAGSGVRLYDNSKDASGYLPTEDVKSFFTTFENLLLNKASNNGLEGLDINAELDKALESYPADQRAQIEILVNTTRAVFNIKTPDLREALPSIDDYELEGRELLARLALQARSLSGNLSKIDTADAFKKGFGKINYSEFEDTLNKIEARNQSDPKLKQIDTAQLRQELSNYRSSANVSKSKENQRKLKDAITNLYKKDPNEDLEFGDLLGIITFSERGKRTGRGAFVNGLKSGKIRTNTNGKKTSEESLINDNQAEDIANIFYAAFAEMPRIYQLGVLKKIGLLDIGKTGGLEMASIIRANLANIAANLTRNLVEQKTKMIKKDDVEIVVPLNLYNRTGKKGAASVVDPGSAAASILYNVLPSEFASDWEYVASVSQEDIFPDLTGNKVVRSRRDNKSSTTALSPYQGGQQLEVLSKQRGSAIKNQLEKDHNYALSRGNLTLPINHAAIDSSYNSAKGDQDTVFEQLVFTAQAHNKIFTDNRQAWVDEFEERASTIEDRETYQDALKLSKERIISPEDEIKIFHKEKAAWKKEKKDISKVTETSPDEQRKEIVASITGYVQLINGPNGINEGIADLKKTRDKLLSGFARNFATPLAEIRELGSTTLDYSDLDDIIDGYTSLVVSLKKVKANKGKPDISVVTLRQSIIDALIKDYKDAIASCVTVRKSFVAISELKESLNDLEPVFKKQYLEAVGLIKKMFDDHIKFLEGVKKTIINNAGSFKDSLKRMDRDFFRNKNSIYNPRRLNDYKNDIEDNIKDYEKEGIERFKEIEKEFKALSMDAQIKLDPTNPEPGILALSDYMYKYVTLKDYILVSSAFY